MVDPISVLGLQLGDTLAIAKKKRNKLFLKLHPDKNNEDKDLYQQVYDAYEILEKNPHILKPISIQEQVAKSIIVKIEVTPEEIYFKTKKTIRVEKIKLCRKCCGLGTTNGESGFCSICNGKGNADSNILDLLGKSSICPVCHGTGIKEDCVCDSCNGAKYKKELEDITFTVSPIDYNKKYILLKNAGNQLNSNLYGPIIIQIKAIPTDVAVTIEDDYFVVYDKVLPIQKIIGDTKFINIFGRKVKYTIEKNSTDAYTVDKISSDNSQTIRIKFIDIAPNINKDTLALYKKILEIEKHEHAV